MQRVGPYEILGVLGSGATSTVYRARHETLGRQVALKVLRSGPDVAGTDRRRFQREARASGMVSHPSLVHVYDADEIDGSFYLAMELVEGESLGELIERSAPLPWPRALAIAISMLDALTALHDIQILHRDIKPANVMMQVGGRVKVVDLGLARTIGPTSLTLPGMVCGTMRYLAPEILSGGDHDPGTDVWAVACVLYQLLTAEPHVSATTMQRLPGAILLEPIVPPAQRVESIPESVSLYVLSMLQRDPAARPGLARATIEGLTRELETAGITVDGALASDSGAAGLPRPVPASSPGDKTEPMIIAPVASAPPGRSRPGVRVSSVATPTPSQAPPVRARTAGLVLAASCAVSLAALGLWRAGRARPAPPIVVASPESTAPAPATSPRAAFFRWPDVEPSLSRLRRTGKPGREAAGELGRRLPVDAGPVADAWILWVDLGRWLAGGGRTSPPVSATATRMTKLELDVVDAGLELAGLDSGPRTLSAILRAMAQYGADPNLWYGLGRHFDLNGCDAEARAVYAHAIALDTRDPLGSSWPLVWTGYLRAHFLLRPEELEKAFWRQAANENRLAIWLALSSFRRAEPATWNPLHERILSGVAPDAPWASRAAVERGWNALNERHDPKAARAIWTAAWNRDRKSLRLADALLGHWLERGDKDRAREPLAVLLAAENASSEAEWAAFLLKGSSTPLWTVSNDGPHGYYIHELRRQLALGRLADAEATAIAGLKRRWTKDVDWIMGPALVGRGTKLDWVLANVRREVRTRLAGGHTADLLAMTGELATPAGLAFLEPLLVEEEVAHPIRALPKLVRGVVLGRLDRDEEALASLSAGLAMLPGDRALDPGALPLILELPARMLGRSGPRAIGPEARARIQAIAERALPRRAPDDLARRFWTELAAGRRDEAARLAEELFDIDPGSPIWGLARLAELQARGDRAALAAWMSRLTLAYRNARYGSWAIRAVAAQARSAAR